MFRFLLGDLRSGDTDFTLSLVLDLDLGDCSSPLVRQIEAGVFRDSLKEGMVSKTAKANLARPRCHSRVTESLASVARRSRGTLTPL